MTGVSDIVAAIERLRADRPRVVVGISGYAGAGKTTLAHQIVDTAPDAVRLPGDDFLDPARVHRRSRDWDGVERDRLLSEVLEPFRDGRDIEVRRMDWSTRRLGAPTPLPRASVLVIDAVGIFHPELLPWLDLTVWVDAEPHVAQQRGMARDRAAGHDHDQLWTDVWTPNDREFERLFSPRAHAALVLDT